MFIELIDYLFKTNNKKLFIILLFNIDPNCTLEKRDKLLSWIENKFSSFLYHESRGNPGYIHLSIKNLYDMDELYLHKSGYWELKSSNLSKLQLPSNNNDDWEVWK